MNDDVRKYIYGALIVFVTGIFLWVSFVFVNACGFTLTCARGALLVDRTPVPTMIPATIPVLPRLIHLPAMTPTPEAAETVTPEGDETSEIARPSNPGGPGSAISLKGDAASGAQLYVTNCIACHGVDGVGGVPNSGSTDGTIPPLDPIDETLKNPDYKTFATNLDLFLQHGSSPEGTNSIFQMPAWGDMGTLTQQQIADIVAYLISLNS